MEQSISIWILISIEITLLVVTLLMALIQKQLIKDQDRIAHGWWSLGFAAICVALWRVTGINVWWFWLAQAIGHLPIFNVLLDIFRDLPVDYVPTAPKSIIDRLLGKALPFVQLVCALLYAGAQALIIHVYGNT